ncbi:MAG: pyridoxal phosphate-dependent aminotransferase [Planctomycetota bacterium]|jgi:putative C-S lyase|nr:pyridoxal phosphate-dependent aminotransferase [Planctomycetota bacterium]
MSYDFTSCSDRSATGSLKWREMLARKPSTAPGVIPFSVADMELPLAPEIVSALADFLSGQPNLGYCGPQDSYYEALADWMERRQNWRPEKEWVVETNGVVPALFTAVSALTAPGEGVILFTPAYHPFYAAVDNLGRRRVEIPLIETGSRYMIDFDRLEEQARQPENRLLLFCSPHNPGSRVWTREELLRLADVCLRHRLNVVSDEIHSDLVQPGHPHQVFPAVSPEMAAQTVLATSPSKTFNLAGLQVSNLIIPNPRLRNAFVAVRRQAGLFHNNLFAYIAAEAAYRRGEAWLTALLLHLRENYALLCQHLGEHFPEVIPFELEGTYLAWLDFRAWERDAKKLEHFLVEEAEVFVSQGRQFGKGGEGFARLNLACPRVKLHDALERLRLARSRHRHARG